jgi:hypothetical protein
MKKKIQFFEPNTPEAGDTITNVLKYIEKPKQMPKPSYIANVLKKGKIIPTRTEHAFTQSIKTSVIFSNGSIAYNRSRQVLSSKDKHAFPEAGYFRKEKGEWLKISEEDYKKIARNTKLAKPLK